MTSHQKSAYFWYASFLRPGRKSQMWWWDLGHICDFVPEWKRFLGGTSPSHQLSCSYGNI